MRYCGNCARLLEVELDLAPPTQVRSALHSLNHPQTIENQVELDTAQRFRQAGLASLGEHRRVTVLFADLSGYTELADHLDPDDLFEVVQDLIQGMVEIIYKYEGVVDKIMGDGIMAIFGAPVALENHSERAVRAALEVQAQVERISQARNDRLNAGLKLHIGINEGTVVVGAIGSDLRMDYTAIGETVNLANRLQEAAQEGEILVSDSIFRSTRALFNYAPATRIQAKGYQQPILAYRFLKEKPRPGSPRGIDGLGAPMVGRQRELALLVASAKNLVEHKKSQFVLVTGEAGIGKSRLKTELKQHLRNQPLLVIEGQSLTYRRSVPYWIFKDLLREFLKLPANAPPILIKERLTSHAGTLLDKRSQESLPFLEHLLLQEQEGTAPTGQFAYLDPEQIRQNIFQSVRDLLLAEAGRQPLVLIFEDLHWADDTSLDLLAFLLETLHRAPVMICAISRPENANQLVTVARLAEQRHGLSFGHVQLDNLSPLQSDQLLKELLKIPELPEYFRLLVLKRAEGIPFYLEEILRMLIDDGVIEFVAGHWRMVAGAEVATLRVPGNLQNLILARVDKLGSEQRSVLQAASVIGAEFPFPVLSQVLPDLNESKLRVLLEGLVKRAFILPPSNEGLSFQFRHVLTSDGVYSTLLRSEKERLHGQVAKAIENHYAGNLEDQVEILAGHFLRSVYLDRALHYLILAGQKAGREYANQQSRQHFSEAAVLLSRVPHTSDQARQIWTGMGDVLTFVGDYPNARKNYQEALSLYDVIGESENNLSVIRECSGLHRKIATTFERQGDFQEALQHLAQANQVLDQSIIPSPYEKAAIFNSTGWIYFLQGRFGEARKSLSSAQKLVEGTKNLDILASIHNRLGAVAYQERSYFESEMHVSESLNLRERMNDKAGVARLYNNLGLLGLMRGNLRMAEENFTQSTTLLERIGDAEGIALTNINLGLVKIDRGDFQAAGSYLAKAMHAAEQIGHRYYLALANLYIGRINTEAGDHAAAGRSLSESLSIFTELGAADGRLDTLFYIAENYLADQDIDQASASSELAEAELNRSDTEISANAVQRGRVLRLQGKIARVKGDFVHARKKLEESDRVFSQSSEKLELGRTYQELGCLAKNQGSRSLAKGYFQRAGLIFDQLGADRDLCKVKKELDHLNKSF